MLWPETDAAFVSSGNGGLADRARRSSGLRSMHATPIQMRAPAQTAVLMGAGMKMPRNSSAVGRPQAKT
jgi:hypothetical protein